jgi:hypothetical protein
MLESGLPIRENPDGNWLGEQPSVQIHVNSLRCYQGVDVIPCRESLNLPDKFRQGNAG